MRLVVLLGCLAILNVPPDAINPAAPDMISHSDVVLTMETSQPRAEAIAILRDRITAVGDDEDVVPLASRTTRLVDLSGRTVMPVWCQTRSGGLPAPFRGRNQALARSVLVVVDLVGGKDLTARGLLR